jgi:hypothetical protein
LEALCCNYFPEDLPHKTMPKSPPEELYHYTGIHGLKGIVESQTLWATHYKYLNDAIVGPHPEKEKRKIAVKKLLSQNNIQADVSVSAIPYLG